MYPEAKDWGNAWYMQRGYGGKVSPNMVYLNTLSATCKGRNKLKHSLCVQWAKAEWVIAPKMHLNAIHRTAWTEPSRRHRPTGQSEKTMPNGIVQATLVGAK